jgi:hypothetical protein
VVCAMGRVSQNGVGRVDVGPAVVPGGKAISTIFPVTGEAILHFLLEAGLGGVGATRFLAPWPGMLS